MQFAVFHVILCGFVVFVPPLSPPIQTSQPANNIYTSLTKVGNIYNYHVTEATVCNVQTPLDAEMHFSPNYEKWEFSLYINNLLKMTVNKIILWWSRFWHPAKRKLDYLLEVKYCIWFNDLLGLLLNVDQLRKGALKITVNFFSRPASAELEGTQDISSPV